MADPARPVDSPAGTSPVVGSLGRVLVLSWDIGAGDGGLTRQSAGLARALAEAGADVEVVTRAADRAPRAVDPAHLHMVEPAGPVMTWRAGGRVSRALALAPSVVADVLGQVITAGWPEPAVVLADGWQAGLAGRTIATTFTVPFVQVLSGLEVRRRELGDVPDQDGDAVVDVEAALVHDADVVFARGIDAHLVATSTRSSGPVLPLGFGVAVPATSPDGGGPDGGGPDGGGPDGGGDGIGGGGSVAVLPPRGADDDWVATLGRRLRRDQHVVDLRFRPWPTPPPDLLVVHDVERVDVAVAAVAEGIPVVVGDLAELVAVLGDIAVVARPMSASATAEVVRGLLATPDRCRELAAAGRRHAVSALDWDDVVATFLAGVGSAIEQS